jgi:hypothetical protein
LVHLINTISAIVFLLVTATQKPHSPIPYSPKEIYTCIITRAEKKIQTYAAKLKYIITTVCAVFSRYNYESNLTYSMRKSGITHI